MGKVGLATVGLETGHLSQFHLSTATISSLLSLTGLASKMQSPGNDFAMHR